MTNEMRDPKRIEPILEKLKTIWTKWPDFRLTQLIHTLAAESPDKDPYFLEDDSFEHNLDKWLKE